MAKRRKGELQHYVGTFVVHKEPIPADKRFTNIPRGTRLLVTDTEGPYLWLAWPDGKRASRDGVHFSKLKTG